MNEKTKNYIEHMLKKIDFSDDLASDYSYKNDFDRYQHVDRDDKIYNHYFNYYSKIATKIMKDK